MEDFGKQQHDEEIRKSKLVSALASTSASIIAFWFGSRGSARSRTQHEA